MDMLLRRYFLSDPGKCLLQIVHLGVRETQIAQRRSTFVDHAHPIPL
jgi:hypothetical protein